MAGDWKGWDGVPSSPVHRGFLIQRYWYVCMALIDATPWQNLKNAALLMAVEWQKTGIVLLTAGVLYGVCFLFPLYAFPAMVLCLFPSATCSARRH